MVGKKRQYDCLKLQQWGWLPTAQSNTNDICLLQGLQTIMINRMQNIPGQVFVCLLSAYQGEKDCMNMELGMSVWLKTLKRYSTAVVQWLAFLTHNRWIPVRCETEPHPSLPLCPDPHCSVPVGFRNKFECDFKFKGE